MAAQPAIAFVDGVTSIGSHNNVHRVICYQLTAKGAPETSIELLIPASSLSGLVNALAKLKG
jgi:hypothetical protein